MKPKPAFIQERDKEQSRADLENFAEEQRYHAKLKAVFGTSEGLDILDRWLDEWGVLDPLFITSSDIYRRTALHDFGCQVLADIIAADPEIYIALVKKWSKEHEENKTNYLKQIKENNNG